MLKGKIHRATVTDANLNYEGSISIDSDLLKAADILPYEQVDVLNIHNGARFTTYAIEGAAGSGMIGINGAAARLAQQGDLVIICAYAQMEKAKAAAYKPSIINVNSSNRINR